MKIIYQTETGIAVVHPTGEVPIQQVLQKDVPDQYKATAYIVDDDVIPSDRTFRDAWDHSITEADGKVVHRITENLDKAKDIHKDRLRAEREPLLRALDAEYMIASRKGGDTAAINREKDRLCDITKRVDLCKTTDEIKLVKIKD